MEELFRDVKQFEVIDTEVKDLLKRQARIKKRLMESLEEHGEVDDKGHARYDLPSDQYVGEIRTIVRQRRTGRGFDQEAAEIILKAKGIYYDCVTTVPQIQEDKIFQYLFEKVLTEEEVDKMFPLSESYAFVTVR